MKNDKMQSENTRNELQNDTNKEFVNILIYKGKKNIFYVQIPKHTYDQIINFHVTAIWNLLNQAGAHVLEQVSEIGESESRQCEEVPFNISSPRSPERIEPLDGSVYLIEDTREVLDDINFDIYHLANQEVPVFRYIFTIFSVCVLISGVIYLLMPRIHIDV